MTVDFIKAEPGDEAYTYLPDPGGEYGWVTEPVEFDDLDDPVTVKRQRWRLVDEDTVIFRPRTELCPQCHGEEVIPCPADTDGDGDCAFCSKPGNEHICPTCKGDGRHPFAGEMEVLS